MGFLDRLFGRRKESELSERHEIGELREKGLEAARVGDLRSAVGHWTLAASAEPKNAEIHFLLAAARHVLRDLENSASEYRTTIRLDPRYVEAHLDFAELLVRDALEGMKQTGQKFTLGQALRRFGYYRDVLTSLATCELLIQKATEDTTAVNELRALEWRDGLQRLLGDEMRNAAPMAGIAGPPTYRSPCDWLRSMKFSPDEIIKLTPKGLMDRLSEYIDGRSAVYVLDPVMAARPEIVTLLKERKLPHTQITPSMSDQEIQEALRHLAPGEILLAGIQRVALGRDFPWVYAESWNRFVLVVLHPELLVLPELLGTLARTSTLSFQSVQRVHLYVELSY